MKFSKKPIDLHWIFSAVLFLWASPVLAVLDPTLLETDPGTSLLVDLQTTIENSCATYNCDPAQITNINITVTADPRGNLQQQSATTFLYSTPANEASGLDRFEYAVSFDDPANEATINETGSVIVLYGDSSQIFSVNTPQGAVLGLLESICANNVPALLVTLCNTYANTLTSPGERLTLVNELAPKEVQAQSQTSINLATQKLDDIRKRLAALRQGMQGMDVSRLTFRSRENRSVSMAQLLDYANEQRGGGASGDSLWSGVGLFVSGNFGGGDHNESVEEDAYDFSTKGLTVGTDYRISEQAVAGAAIGLSSLNLDVANDGGDLEVSGYSAIGYSSYYFNPKLYTEVIAAVYKNDVTGNRRVHLLNLGVQTARGETNNKMMSFSAGAGYEAYSQRGLTFNVSGSIDVILSSFDGYAESGADNANLIIEKREATQSTTTVNAQLIQALSMASGVILPQVDLAWRHEFADDAQTIEGSFRGDPNGRRFRFSTEKPDSDYFKLSAGFSYIVPGGNTGFAYYEKILGRSGFNEYNLSLGLRLEF